MTSMPKARRGCLSLGPSEAVQHLPEGLRLDLDGPGERVVELGDGAVTDGKRIGLRRPPRSLPCDDRASGKATGRVRSRDSPFGTLALLVLYSPECVEEEFSEVRMQDRA